MRKSIDRNYYGNSCCLVQDQIDLACAMWKFTLYTPPPAVRDTRFSKMGFTFTQNEVKVGFVNLQII